MNCGYIPHSIFFYCYHCSNIDGCNFKLFIFLHIDYFMRAVFLRDEYIPIFFLSHLIFYPFILNFAHIYILPLQYLSRLFCHNSQGFFSGSFTLNDNKSCHQSHFAKLHSESRYQAIRLNIFGEKKVGFKLMCTFGNTARAKGILLPVSASVISSIFFIFYFFLAPR